MNYKKENSYFNTHSKRKCFYCNDLTDHLIENSCPECYNENNKEIFDFWIK